ncbi:hypothetical protein EW146_g7211 [Bondarzewia mesenterica]|uniref:Uncharacterized protein n=1 Tax=Bondarzewia mesenterica TaxID=1095465 RepID=A0A4S4LLG7_9AGAM|nr:hypothetical protein EW146_g7211 [Bondarzewia mesenterica]
MTIMGYNLNVFVQVFDSTSSLQAVGVTFPPEILGRIIELTLPDPPPCDFVQLKRSPHLPRCTVKERSNERARMLLVLSHVSRYWRAVITSHASLWSSIEAPLNHCSTGERDIVKLCAERSKDTLLRMTNFHDHDLTFLVRESHRLVYLSLYLEPEHYTGNRMHAPQLESLLLASMDPSSFPDLPDFMQSDFPRLRRLWLQGFTSWSKYRFSHLTHLMLSRGEATDPISMIHFLDLLRENAGLELLVLDEVYLTLDHAARPPHPVQLLRLRYLVTNNMYYDTIRNVISLVKVPPTTPARFRMRRVSWQDITQIFSIETYPQLILTNDTVISIVVWQQREMSCFIYNQNYRFEISICESFGIGPGNTPLRFSLPMVDNSQIRELSIEISSKATGWRPLFFPFDSRSHEVDD